MSAEPRRRLAPQARRAQLITVAGDVFAERGYQGTTMEDIAAVAGVSRPLVYKYFTDKDEIYLECVRVARAELDEAISAAAVGADGPEAELRAGLGAYFAFVRDRGSQWDVLFGGGAAVAGAVAEASARHRAETVALIGALLGAAAPGVGADAASTYAHAISGAAEQAAKWWRRAPHVDVDTLVARMMDVLWTGLEQIAARSG